MGMIWLLAAALWGFAEATLFFIVPDVFLTAAAVHLGLSKALRLCVAAAVGATIGGVLMWHWGAADADTARHALLHVPAIAEDLLTRVRAETAQGWAAHLALGPLTGTPYKIYAVEAGAANINAFVFAAVSFVARLPRFLVTTVLAAAVHAYMNRRDVVVSPYVILAIVWIVNYAIYFYLRN